MGRAVQVLWDRAEAHVRRNPRKYTVIGAVAMTAPLWEWVTSAVKAMWTFIAVPVLSSTREWNMTVPDSLPWISAALGLALMMFVWWETRPPKPQDGHVYLERLATRLTNNDVDERFSGPDRFDRYRAEVADQTPPLPGDQEGGATDSHAILLKWLEEPNSLSMQLKNTTADIVQGCGIEVTDLKLWSLEHEEWIKVSAYYSPTGKFYAPFTLRGEGTIFPKERSRFGFITTISGRFGIDGRHGNAQRPLPIPKAGKWRMQVNVLWAGQKRPDTVFYESFEDRTKRPAPTTDPSRVT